MYVMFRILYLSILVPPNGLVIYCGTIVTDEGKEKKVNIDFEPFKPINTSLYLCDNKFHTEALTALLADDNKFGFIVMDGNGALFGTLQGNTREVLHKFTVDLPKKHGRGTGPNHFGGVSNLVHFKVVSPRCVLRVSEWKSGTTMLGKLPKLQLSYLLLTISPILPVLFSLVVQTLRLNLANQTCLIQ